MAAERDGFATSLLQKTQGVDVSSIETGLALNLKGVFLTHAAAGSSDLAAASGSFLTRQSLILALNCVGIQPREALLKQYALAMLDSPTLSEATSSSSSSSSSAAALAKRRASRPANPVLTKVNMQVFITMTAKELALRNKSQEKDLDPLFAFMNEPGRDAESISIKQLRHLLVETLSPSRLDAREFAAFVAALNLGPANSGKSDDVLIKIADLKRRMLF